MWTESSPALLVCTKDVTFWFWKSRTELMQWYWCIKLLADYVELCLWYQVSGVVKLIPVTQSQLRLRIVTSSSPTTTTLQAIGHSQSPLLFVSWDASQVSQNVIIQYKYNPQKSPIFNKIFLPRNKASCLQICEVIAPWESSLHDDQMYVVVYLNL